MFSFFYRYATFTLVWFLIFGSALLVLRPYIKINIASPGNKYNASDVLTLGIYQLIVLALVLDGAITVLPLVLLLSLTVSDKQIFFHEQGRFWTGIYLQALCVDVEISGELPKGQMILIQNIESYLDGAATLSRLPVYFRTVFLRHLFPMDNLSWLEGQMGYLALEQGDISLMHADVQKILSELNDEENILTFAVESDGKLTVYGGTALFALESKVPIVPIYVEHKETGIGSFLTPRLPYELKIRVGKPLNLPEASGEMNGKIVREMISAEMTRLAKVGT